MNNRGPALGPYGWFVLVALGLCVAGIVCALIGQWLGSW